MVKQRRRGSARQPQRQAAPRSRKRRTVAVPSAPDDQPVLHTVVGIGASAGGFEAVNKLLQQVTPDSGLAFVLVQHLAPQHESVLAELLAGVARIPVVQAEEHMPLRPNRVHVIPPNAHMTIADGHLHLVPRPLDRTQYNPIDSFFQSLAAQVEHRAVGVILSGSASDGAIGLREIKGAGGFTMVQDPATAAYDGMPRAAIATGAADLILPPEGLGSELVRLGTHPFLAADQRQTDDLTITDAQLERLFYLLRATSGVDFTYYKLPTIKRRLLRRMALHKVTSTGDYLRLLDREPDEVRKLYRDILIHVTRFFREPESFVVLATKVFPQLLEGAAGGRAPVRVWVPGCATGEEAYSIAIAVLEYLGTDAPSVTLQVFATDVSDEAIEKARVGVYPESISADVSADRLRRFFTRVDGQLRVNKIVRDSCIFARQDLTRDPPFSKLNLIVCRNVLIYLGPRLQQQLMAAFHYALKPLGFLMLGATETVGPHGELFALTDKRHRLYQKRQGLGGAVVALPTEIRQRPDLSRRPLLPTRHTAVDLQTEVNRLLLSRYTPPGVVVNADLQIVHTRGKTGSFLELASGDATLSLLKMAREGTLDGLRSALKEAKKTGRPARREGLLIRTSTDSREVDVQVVPFSDSSEVPYFLVLFEDPAPPRQPAPRSAGRGKRGVKDPARIARLQQELTSSREYLQSIIQDLEAANEELQSANEEILSSNEELQSTNEELDTAKEELQSTNEELNTVNEELNARNDELSQANADLTNLLIAVPAAVVIVTGDLRIRRFTPMAEQVLNLIPTDIGRPLSDLRPNISMADLDDVTREVIEDATAKELEVSDRFGRKYLLRIRPYKDRENRTDGAVLAFIDLPGTGGERL